MMGEGAGAGAGDVSMTGGGTGATTLISSDGGYKTGAGGEADFMIVDVSSHAAEDGRLLSRLNVEVMQNLGQTNGDVICLHCIKTGQEIEAATHANFSQYMKKPYGFLWAESEDYRVDGSFRVMMRAPVDFSEWLNLMLTKTLQEVMEELWDMAQITSETWEAVKPSMKFYMFVDAFQTPDGCGIGWRYGVHKTMGENCEPFSVFTSVKELGKLLTFSHLPMEREYVETCMTVESAAFIGARTTVTEMFVTIPWISKLQSCMLALVGNPSNSKVTTENLWRALKRYWQSDKRLAECWDADGRTPIDYSMGGDEREFAGMMLARLYALSNLRKMDDFDVDFEEDCIDQYKTEGFFGEANAGGVFDGKYSYMLLLLSRFYEEVRLNQERHREALKRGVEPPRGTVAKWEARMPLLAVGLAANDARKRRPKAVAMKKAKFADEKATLEP